MAGGDDELRLNASLEGDLADALRKIETRLDAVDTKLDELARSGKSAGDSVAQGAEKASDKLGETERAAKGAATGMEAAARAARNQGRAATEAAGATEKVADELGKAGRAGETGAKGLDDFAGGARKTAAAAFAVAREAGSAARKLDEAGDEAVQAGAKAAASSSGWDKLWRAIDRNERISRRFAAAHQAMKWSTWSSGVEKMHGSFSKLTKLDYDGASKKLSKLSQTFGGFSKVMMAAKFGAIAAAIVPLLGLLSSLGAGAVGAIGLLGSLAPGLAAIAPVALTAKVAMLGLKAAMKLSSDETAALSKKFSVFGEAIAEGGLKKGLNYMTNNLGVVTRGLQNFGKSIGYTAEGFMELAADYTKSAEFIGQYGVIIDNAKKIFTQLAAAGYNAGKGIVAGLAAASPTASRLAEDLKYVALGFSKFMQAGYESGTMAATISHAYDMIKRAIGVVVDWTVGLFRIFRIAAQESAWMGKSIEDSARKFREWTGSISGQNAIRDYFAKAMPTVREAGLLIRDLFTGFGKMATGPDMAPLLNQIRTQLLPAVMLLVSQFSSGLLPMLVDFASRVATLFAGLDFSGLAILMGMLNGFVGALVWAQQTIPGFNFLLSTLLTILFLLGPAFAIVGWIVKIFGMLASVWGLLVEIGGGVMAIISVIGWPVTLIIIAIVAVVATIIWLWNNCQWFRDGVWAVLSAVGDFFVWLWGIIWPVLQGIGGVLVWVGGVFMTIFSAIGTAASWFWFTILWPILSVMITIFKVIAAILFTVVVGTFLIVFNILAAIITWWWQNVTLPVLTAVGAFFVWIFQNVIMPVVNFFIMIWQGIVFQFQLLCVFVQAALTVLGAIFTWIFMNVIMPVIQFLQLMWNTFCIAIGILYHTFIEPILVAFGVAFNWLYTNIIMPVVGFIMALWNALGIAIGVMYNTYIKPIFDAIGIALNVLKGWFDATVSGIGIVWNTLKGMLAKPVNFMINTVWNNGIAKAWNWAAGLLGLPPAGMMAPIPENAKGGVMPGYTPGRDNQLSWVSGGEAIMRPEWTRAMGADYVNDMNAAARSGGVEGVRKRARMTRLSPMEKLLGGDKQNPGLAFADGGIVGEGQRFAQGQAGKPYVWGGAGPGGYDCSGFMSAIYGVLTRQNPYVHRFGTGQFGTRGTNGFVPGRGTFTVGVSPNTGDGIGHMAGSLGNMNVESRGGDGVVIGPSARGAINSLFPRQFFLPQAGDTFMGSAGSGDGGGFFDVGAWVRGIVNGFVDPLLNALPHAPPTWMDSIPGVPRKAKDSFVDWAIEKLAFMGGGGGDGVSGTGPIADQVRGVARNYGWDGGPQWGAIDWIVGTESSWNPTAKNPTSSAYGLFQIIDGTWRSLGVAGDRSNPAIQAQAGLKYIKQRYQDPIGAKNFHLSRGWYDDGGMLPPGLSLAMNGTGSPEPVFTTGQWDTLQSLNGPDRFEDYANSLAPKGGGHDGGYGELSNAVDGLATMLAERPPPLSVSDEHVERAVFNALDKRDRLRRLREQYNYGG